MKRLAIVLVAICLAVIVWYIFGGPREPRAAPPSTPAAVAAGPAHLQHVVKLDAIERARFVERIRAARVASTDADANPVQRTRRPEATLPRDRTHLSSELRATLGEASRFLAGCYEIGGQIATNERITGPTGDVSADGMEVVRGDDRGASKTARISMKLTGDPDVGTLIEPAAMVDAGGKPLPTELGDCLRTTLESLALPPLGEGNSIDIHYDFTFD